MPARRAVDGAGVFAAAHHAVITRTQAAELGLRSSTIAALKADGLVTEPVGGVLVFVAAPATWHQRLAIATSVARSAGVVSHRAAARLHRLDGFASAPVEVTLPRGTLLRLPGVIRHQVAEPVPPDELVTIAGLPCTSLARTVCDAAAVIHREAVERMMDDVERRGTSLTWIEHTAQRLHRPGQSGTGRVLRDLATRGSRGRVRDSWFEALLERCLDSPRIPTVIPQYELHDHQGVFVARIDLAIPLVRLGLEAHSRRFHTGRLRERLDEGRDLRAAEIGWDLKYLGYADVDRTPKQVCQLVERLVLRRAHDLGIALPWA